MAVALRRLLTFTCGEAALGASLDGEAGETGLLFVTGGTQTRIGSHRLFERLAAAFAERGHASFRFDRRGVGDSEGEDPGWRDSGPDLAAAALAFRRETRIRRLIGFGLCDGASALALHAGIAGLDALILVNPWFVEAESGEPAAAAVRDHYRRQLTSLSGWKKLLTGAISYRKLLTGLQRIMAEKPSSLSAQIAERLEAAALPVEMVLARRDATAIAALAEWQTESFRTIRKNSPSPLMVESDSHTFARPGDFDALLAACLRAVERISGGR
jgi:exosortase A-associated hydrolase 1